MVYLGGMELRQLDLALSVVALYLIPPLFHNDPKMLELSAPSVVRDQVIPELSLTVSAVTWGGQV